MKYCINDRLKRRRRSLAKKLIMCGPGTWSDRDISLLLNELEIEIGEGTNRFLYEDECSFYCSYLIETIPFERPKTADQVYDQIIWLWSTWEAISKATGISWWHISEEQKYRLSLNAANKDQQLKERFKYFDDCDKIFAYISRDEGDDNDYLTMEESIYY